MPHKDELKNIYCLIQANHIKHQEKFFTLLRDRFNPLWPESKLAKLIEGIIEKYFPDIDTKDLLKSVIDGNRIVTPTSSASSSMVFLPQANQNLLRSSAEIHEKI